jgi:hypothetical protein
MMKFLSTSAEIEGPEPVAPHLKAMMAESESLYQAHIRSNPALYESEKAKLRANWQKYSIHFPK